MDYFDRDAEGRPFTGTAERNREPILAVLRDVLATTGSVLEIGAGTGQHAAYFAPELPHLTWQPSDIAAQLPGIAMWCDGPANLCKPIALDVTRRSTWPTDRYEAVFSANTVQVIPWSAVELLFACVATVLVPGGPFCLYGPFSENGVHNSEGNASFDQRLKQRDPTLGVRDIRDLQRAAAAVGLAWERQVGMPANNRILMWRRA